MSFYEKKPPPKSSWVRNGSDPTEEVSFALLKLLNIHDDTSGSDDEFDDPIEGIYPHIDKSNATASWAEIISRRPEMLARKGPGENIKTSFNSMFDCMKGDRERISKLSTQVDRLSNQLFDLEQSQDDELDSKLADFESRHEADSKEVTHTLENMKGTIDDLAIAQIQHAKELAHHSQDAGLALADLTLSLQKSHNMNVKERCAMYFVTGKLTEIKDDLHKNADADEQLKNTVESMKLTLNKIIENNTKKLERKRELKRRRREERLANSIHDANPHLGALTEKLEHLKLAASKIQERAERQSEIMKKREVALDEIEKKMKEAKEYSDMLHAKSTDLALRLKEGIEQSEAEETSLDTVAPVVNGTNVSKNSIVNSINDVARMKSVAAMMRSKSFRHESSNNEDDLNSGDNEKVGESVPKVDVSALLKLKLTEDHPEDLHELHRELKKHSEEHTKHKVSEQKLQEALDKEKASFVELSIENDAFQKQIAKEKEVHDRRMEKHEKDIQELAAFKNLQEEEAKRKKEEEEANEMVEEGDGDREEEAMREEEGMGEEEALETVQEDKVGVPKVGRGGKMADVAVALQRKKRADRYGNLIPVRLTGRHNDENDENDEKDNQSKKVRLPVAELNRLMKRIEQAEKKARLDRGRMERLNQYLESLRVSLGEIQVTANAWDEAVRVLEAAMEQIEVLKLDKQTFGEIKDRVNAIEALERDRDLPGRLKVSDLLFRLPAIERAVADLRVKGVLEQQIEVLAHTKADATVFTGQIAAMSGSLRAMVNDVRHSDHQDVNDALKSIANRLDNEHVAFEELSKKVESSAVTIGAEISNVTAKTSPPVIMQEFRTQTAQIVEEAMIGQAQKIASQGGNLKKFRDKLAQKPHEGMVQQLIAESMDSSLAQKDRELGRLSGLVEMLSEETSNILTREELTNIISSRVMQLLDLGFEPNLATEQFETPQKVIQAALKDRPGIKGNRRKFPPQQSALVKNKRTV